jgi:hypothetical protein
LGKQPGHSSLVKIGQSDSYPVNAPTEHNDNTSPSPHDRVKRRKQKHQGNGAIGNATGLRIDSSTTTRTRDFRKNLSDALISQPIRLSLEPFTDNVTFSYFFDAYNWINIHSILLQDTPMRQHLTQQTDELGYDSLRALAYGIFGRDHQVEGLRRSAERIYGKILQTLQSKLATTSKSELASLIKPISIMGSYAVSSAAALISS